VAKGYDFVGDTYNSNPALPGYNPVPAPDTDPDNCEGQGTQVAGIIGANGTITGVAPAVTFYAYRVFGCSDRSHPAHFEHWTSPTITIARPAPAVP
jgi:minor extracellular serine protease Vpr